MELGLLNRIVDYNENLAYVTLEPGVTQRQLFEYLEGKKSNLMMSVTGSTPDSSLIGNTLERGVGKGPLGDRFAHICGLEVVLPTGECIHTGFERFANAKAAKVNRWGLGPYFDGIFTQSNFGIVTQMTMWLIPHPKYFQSFFYSINDDASLEELIDTLRSLNLFMAYWRKPSPVPSNIDPDKDGCGIIWLAPSVPFEGHHVRAALRIIEQTARLHSFEPNVGLQCVTQRSIDMTVAILYDTDVAGEDERAFACHEQMMQKLVLEGYIPYRLTTQLMDSQPPAQDDYGKLLQQIKKALDPNNILAPGRYDFRSD